MPHPIPSPIICGQDMGVYALARSFHEAYGVPSTVVTRLPRGPINDSRIVEPSFLGPGGGGEDLVARVAVHAADARAAGREPVLLVNVDSQVDLVQSRREWFDERMTVLLPPPAISAAVEDKTGLAALAGDLGLSTPREVVVGDDDAWRDAAADLPGPYILKPAASGPFEVLSFPGKRKVYLCESLDEAARHVDAARAGGFAGAMLLQELIPGDDTHNYVVTCYVDRSGRVTLTATARMLLAMHTPVLLGNIAIGLVDWYPEVAGMVTDLLLAMNYRGFATVDVKVHARTGVPYLLDVNPRIGRSNYMVNVGGTNPVEVALDDSRGVERAPERTRTPGIYRIVPFALARRYVPAPLRGEVLRLARRRRPVQPLRYGPDTNPKRTAYRLAAEANYVRSFLRDYPRVTDASF